MKILSKFSRAPVLIILVVLFAVGVACSSASTPPPEAPNPPANVQPVGSLAPVARTTNGGAQGDGISSLSSLESENTSEINIELSRTSESVERYFFVIQRDTSQISFVDPESEEIVVGTGEILAKLTLESSESASFRDTPDGEVRDILGLVVQYDEGILRLLEANDQVADLILHTSIDLGQLQQIGGVSSAMARANDDGLTATLEVDVASQDDESSEPTGGSAGLDLSQDKAQRTFVLNERVNKGTIVINVLYRGVAPPIAFAPPPVENRPEDSTDQEDPDSGESANPPPQQQGGGNNAAPSGGPDSGSGSSGSSSNPPPPPTTVEVNESPEFDPEGNQSIPDDEGVPDIYADNVDLYLVFDSSNNILNDDPLRKRLDAAIAFLEVLLPDDQIGVISIGGTEIVEEPLTKIPVGGSSGSSLKRIRNVIEDISGTGLTTERGLRQGLTRACSGLVLGRSQNRAAIFLTDGVLNIGNFDSTLSGAPHQCFAETERRLYTIGIGRYRQDVITKLAGDTNAEPTLVGVDFRLLTCELQLIRSKMANLNYRPCEPGQVKSDGSNTFDTVVNVPTAQRQASFTINWDGDVELDMHITPPGGRSFFQGFGAPRPFIQLNSTESLTFPLPEPGEWKVSVHLRASRRSDDPTPTAFPPPVTNIPVVFGFSTIPATSP